MKKQKIKNLLADVYRDEGAFLVYLEHEEGLDDQDIISVLTELIKEVPNLEPDTASEPEDQSGWS